MASSRWKSGITLFELLLVLTLLVVIGSFAMPLLTGAFSSVRLTQASDQIRAAWSHTRGRAIESGEVYQFRFQPATAGFRIERWQAGVDPLLNTVSVVVTDVADLAGEQADEHCYYLGGLPEQIVFVEGSSLGIGEGGLPRIDELTSRSDSEWSLPILFYPDGTTSPATVLIRNQKDIYRRITLRSLTGVARASESLTLDEVKRLKSY